MYAAREGMPDRITVNLKRGSPTLSETKPGEHRPILAYPGVSAIVVACVGTVVLFLLRQFPEFDIAISRMFFSAEDCADGAGGENCGAFVFANDPFWDGLRNIGYYLPQTLMLLFCLWLAWLLMFRRTKSLEQITIPIIAIVSAMIAPGVVANLILKEFWGRPRPFMTEDFSGSFPFVLPGNIAPYCETNCSFVSGEATAAFWMLVIALCFTGRARVWAAAGISIVASGISFLRVVFGKHYFSDVTIAALIAVFSIAFTCWLVQTPMVSRWIERLLAYSNDKTFGHRLDARRKMKSGQQ